jgi:hypothetical protein
VRGAEGTANHTKEKKQKDEEAKTDGFGTWAAKKPARRRKFLFGGYYSLDRGPLMGTSRQSEMPLKGNHYG